MAVTCQQGIIIQIRRELVKLEQMIIQINICKTKLLINAHKVYLDEPAKRLLRSYLDWQSIQGKPVPYHFVRS